MCAVLVAAFAVALPGTAMAQYPRSEPGRFEVRGLDFRATGAWRNRAAPIREHRRALLRVGALSRLNAAAAPGYATTRVQGTFRVPVLLVRPANVAEPFPVSRYQTLLFDDIPTDRPYSLRSFYTQLSNGNIRLEGNVRGWWLAPQPNTYYEDGCNGVGVLNSCPNSGRMGELLLGALAHFDDGVLDWGQFDNDGPDAVPNSGDDDGYVDFVTFIHPDVDGACRTSHIWAHRWVISAWNGGRPYETRTQRSGGGRILVDDYTMQSGVGGSSACNGSQIMPIGTVAHETGHAFGLPDLYDTEPSGRASQGIGEWGLMGSGNYRSPDSPSRFEAWSLAELGWVTVDTLNASRIVTLGPVVRSDSVFVIPMPRSDEYYLVENRQPLESDSALLNPNRFGGRLPGLLVWHVDQGKLDAEGFRTTNTVNSGAIHGVALVQADGFNQLRQSGSSNRGDSGDPYPGSTGKRKLSWGTNPRSEDNAGGYAGFMLDQIEQLAPGGAMGFRFTRRARSRIAGDPATIEVTVDGVPAAPFEDVLVPGVPVAVSAAELFPQGDVRFRFREWSNGQPRTFTLTPRAGAPDTVIARYDREFRVLADWEGTGDVLGSIPGVQTGVYVAASTPVTLTARPAPGAEFLGWSGDTAGTALVMELPMRRPYSVRARFSVSPEVVAIVDAVRALFGSGPTLSAPVAQGLDGQGNRNGRLDVGDVLAYLDRNRATLSPDLLRRLLADAEASSQPSERVSR
ncbi:MAG TPA: M6 family metalloprotease domain-containing protein [Gemmatimonadales bacterium]|nr:M6 family metalloprotease domain-containing protein [Gemmatimonadales bacterium]